MAVATCYNCIQSLCIHIENIQCIYLLNKGFEGAMFTWLKNSKSYTLVFFSCVCVISFLFLYSTT